MDQTVNGFGDLRFQRFNIGRCARMGRLLISRAECRATSARRRTTAHLTVLSTVLRSGYLVNKTVSYVLISVILVSMIL
jgi:hypothetical protein